jgi:RsiW-degrading membrane proteinase PrsW (M82 family)
MTVSGTRYSLLVLALFFFSGAAALVYQLAWVRSFTLTSGASHEALGVVLAAFVGGLALGGVAFGVLLIPTSLLQRELGRRRWPGRLDPRTR